MRILIAPDKFKGSLTTFEVCHAIEQGLREASTRFRLVSCPMADGGDGLADVMGYYTGAEKQTALVQDPLGRTIAAEWLLAADGKTAVIEMAKASGLARLRQEEFNPLRTSSYGTGQLIRAALEKGVSKIILGLGGSATNDGGIGMAAALGYRFLDDNGQDLEPVGGSLKRIASINGMDKIDLRGVQLEVASDVKNVLLGSEGATYTYGPQKGADEAMVRVLEEGMKNFSTVLKKSLGIDVSMLEGGGAAGGLGAGCIAFLQAECRSGIDLVMRYADFESHLQQADIVLTGEGKIDRQTLKGKVVMGVASMAKKQKKPVIAFCGSQELSAPEAAACGIDALFPVLKYPMAWQEAKEKAHEFLKDTAFSVGRLLQWPAAGR